jgi:hypothetical protein
VFREVTILEVDAMSFQSVDLRGAIVSWEIGDEERMKHLSLTDRGKLIEAACQAAVVVENARLSLGWPAAEPEPWLDSTWDFLREGARRARERS